MGAVIRNMKMQILVDIMEESESTAAFKQEFIYVQCLHTAPLVAKMELAMRLLPRRCQKGNCIRTVGSCPNCGL